MEVVEVYVDGSFNFETNTIGWAVIIPRTDGTIKILKGKIKDKKLVVYNNIVGEFMAVYQAVLWAIRNQVKVIIHTDFDGCYQVLHPDCYPSSYISQLYKKTMIPLIEHIEKWNKIKSHTRNTGNILADAIAKSQSGITTKF